MSLGHKIVNGYLIGMATPTVREEGYKFTAAIMSQSATNLDGGYNDNNTFENASQLL
jgi:carbohydrate-selective porin OprB